MIRITTAGAHALCALAVLVTGACASPRVDPLERGEPALVEIHAALVDAVDWARTNGDIDWYSGWTGNAMVHATDDQTLGLCYEWQELVWDYVRPVVKRVGWRADGITINADTWSAHYAVVVWDPARVRRADLLTLPESAPAFVLDPWRNGEPETYTVAAWVDIPIIVMAPPALESLGLEYGRIRRFGPAVDAPGTAP